MNGPVHIFNSEMKKMIKLNGGTYNPGDEDSLVQSKRGWVIGQEKMDMLINNIESNYPEVRLRKIPDFVYKALHQVTDCLYYLDDKRMPIEIEYPI